MIDNLHHLSQSDRFDRSSSVSSRFNQCDHERYFGDIRAGVKDEIQEEDDDVTTPPLRIYLYHLF